MTEETLEDVAAIDNYEHIPDEHKGGYNYFNVKEGNGIQIFATTEIQDSARADAKIPGQMYSPKHEDLENQGYYRYLIVKDTEVEKTKKELKGLQFKLEEAVAQSLSKRLYLIEGIKIFYLKE